MYNLNLTAEEASAYAWLAARGYVPDWDLSEGDNAIPEHVAWDLPDHCEQQDAGGHDWFPCAGPPLTGKLTALWEEIV